MSRPLFDDVKILLPGENTFYSFDYVDMIPSGGSLSGQIDAAHTWVKCIDANGNNVTATLVSQVQIANTTQLKAMLLLSNAVANMDYVFTFTGVMVPTNEYVNFNLLVRVRSPASIT